MIEFDVIDYELGWLVGWLEGEAYFGCSVQKATNTRKAYKRLNVRVATIDKDTGEKAAQLVTGSRLFGPYQAKQPLADGGLRKPYWQWGIAGNSACVGFMEFVYPYMSLRRQEQIISALRKAQK